MTADGSRPTVSVIVPTHDRRDLLEQLLASLERQTHPIADMEIVVCADDCRDDTLSMLRGRSDLPVKVLELPGVGPAAARNAGAAAAGAQLLIFLDDDVRPMPGLVEAHVEAHRENPGCVVLGPYPPAPWPSRSLARLMHRHWWTQHFADVAEPGHRMRYRDVLTGNLSVTAQLWHEIGGLDERLRAHEDYEFGIRLIQAGIPIVFAPRALGLHHEHETKSLDGALLRAREEGRAEALIALEHPEVRAALRLVTIRRGRGRKTHLVHRTVFAGGKGMDGAARHLGRLLGVLDRRGLRDVHARLYVQLSTYWFVRGVSQSLRSFSAWQDIARLPAARKRAPALVLDLRPGLPSARALLDAERPERAHVQYGGRLLGHLPLDVGAEPWRGAHLDAVLLGPLGSAYLHARAEDCTIDGMDAGSSRRLASGISRMSRYFGVSRPPFPLQEQDEQWRLRRRPRRS